MKFPDLRPDSGGKQREKVVHHRVCTTVQLYRNDVVMHETYLVVVINHQLKDFLQVVHLKINIFRYLNLFKTAKEIICITKILTSVVLMMLLHCT